VRLGERALGRSAGRPAGSAEAHSPTSSKPFLPSMTRQNLFSVTASSVQPEASHVQYGLGTLGPGWFASFQTKSHLRGGGERSDRSYAPAD